jgi:hypothetical protein
VWGRGRDAEGGASTTNWEMYNFVHGRSSAGAISGSHMTDHRAVCGGIQRLHGGRLRSGGRGGQGATVQEGGEIFEGWDDSHRGGGMVSL